MRRMLKNKFLRFFIGLLLVGWVVSLKFSQKVQIATMGTVLREDLWQRVTIAGTVYPNRKTIIAAPYNAYVKKLYVQIGDSVRVGDPIVSLAQSLLESHEVEYPLRAPFSGVVVQTLKTEGEYVEQQGGLGAGNNLVRIDDLTKLFVEATVPEIEVGKLTLGQEAVMKASAVLNRSYQGKIQRIALAAKEQKDWEKSRVEFSVLIKIMDQDEQIKPGMSVIIDIITSKVVQALTLKHEFIQKDGNQYFVITEKGQKKEIKVGLQNEEAFEIKEGVVEGERIRQTDFLSILSKG